MEILNLKDSVEKDSFFRKLPTLAEQLPRPIVTKKVLTRFIILFSILNFFVLFLFYFSIFVQLSGSKLGKGFF